jgi:tRNA threonylcarbamoyladenosine biosynthesis protein TsaB
MTLILNMDTSGPLASVSIASDGKVLHSMEHRNEKDDAVFLAPAISELLQITRLTARHLSAVAISAGPGSYTGLRISSATGKGLCYALRIPLIAISSLKVMAHAMLDSGDPVQLYCPMLDARRLEVYTAMYDRELNEIMHPRALILDSGSFSEVLALHPVLFSGTGSLKWKALHLPGSPHAFYRDIEPGPSHLAELSYSAFREGDFTDPVYFESLYLKAFHSATQIKK